VNQTQYQVPCASSSSSSGSSGRGGQTRVKDIVMDTDEMR